MLPLLLQVLAIEHEVPIAGT